MTEPSKGCCRHRLSRRVTDLPVGLLLVVLAVPSGALGATLTLEQAETRALAANPTARIAKLETLAAKARTAQAYARHLGDADLVASGSRYEGPRLVKPITGPITPAIMAAMPFARDQLHYGATWQIPLFVGGALVLGDQAARLAERAAEDQATQSNDEVRYNVRAAYRGVLVSNHALGAAVAYEEALQQDETSARLRVETQSWSDADAAKVSFALASARARHAALAAQQRNAMTLLGALMGEDSDATYELEDLPEAAEPPVVGTSGELLEAAAGHRHDLTASHEAAEAQAERAAAVRAGFAPQLAFVGSYLWNDGRDIGRPLETYELTLQLRIPIFSDVGRAFAVREADAAAAQAAERARAKGMEVRGQMIDAEGRIDAARAAFDAGKAQRSLGAEVARVEKLKLDAGTGKVEDYLTARAQQLDGETGYWQGLYGLQSAYDYFALVTGTGG
jgi:outer membrane protein TolC